MKIIAVTNNKGGVGKTTTSSSIAAAMAHNGLSVLLVDLDDQGNLTYSLGAAMDSPRNIGALLTAKPAEAKQWKALELAPDLHLVPSHVQLSSYMEKVRSHKDSDYLLRNQLARFADGKYDYVVLDCPPSLTDGMASNAFCAADVFIVPTDPEPFSVRGLARIMGVADRVKQLLNPGLLFGGFVFTRFNPNIRGRLRQDMLNAVREKYGPQSILGNVRQDAELAEAQASQQTIFTYAPQSRGAADYQELTNNLLLKITPNGKG